MQKFLSGPRKGITKCHNYNNAAILKRKNDQFLCHPRHRESGNQGREIYDNCNFDQHYIHSSLGETTDSFGLYFDMKFQLVLGILLVRLN
ncbi:hypothetical protein RCL_jg4654.t1 [Rhizophagus clarus]|uniref:Uncharacterized protein n=1 Tax=Rhizophagus clarus TaxID=94130 RepID=A0A8H3KR05_9GLOM|nr:hypothetical protein RCL_jg4654.t1 [Rhizophagus clarus]